MVNPISSSGAIALMKPGKQFLQRAWNIYVLATIPLKGGVFIIEGILITD
jgi:hypothetical protein